MKSLNKFHIEILIGKLRDLQDKKHRLKTFAFTLLEHKQAAKSEREQDARQASIDNNELEIEFLQDQIERIEQIIIDNAI
jgi:hypothetical protein